MAGGLGAQPSSLLEKQTPPCFVSPLLPPCSVLTGCLASLPAPLLAAGFGGRGMKPGDRCPGALCEGWVPPQELGGHAQVRV